MIAVEDRHHFHGPVYADLLDIDAVFNHVLAACNAGFIGDGEGTTGCQQRFGKQVRVTLREHGRAEMIERTNNIVAVIGEEYGNRASRRMVGRLALPFDYDDLVRMGELGGYANAGNAGADDENVGVDDVGHIRVRSFR